jgi:hypothetical protein
MKIATYSRERNEITQGLHHGFPEIHFHKDL